MGPPGDPELGKIELQSTEVISEVLLIVKGLTK